MFSIRMWWSLAAVFPSLRGSMSNCRRPLPATCFPTTCAHALWPPLMGMPAACAARLICGPDLTLPQVIGKMLADVVLRQTGDHRPDLSHIEPRRRFRPLQLAGMDEIVAEPGIAFAVEDFPHPVDECSHPTDPFD